MNKVQKALLPVFTFARIDIKRLFRDKVAIFFVFLFPLIFLIIFGSIFNSDSEISFRVAFINNSKTASAQSIEKEIRGNKVFDIDKESTTLDAAKQKMNRGQLDATIILPTNFGAVNGDVPGGEAVVLYDQGNSQASTALASVMQSIFGQVNNKIVPYTPPFTVTTQSTATKGLTQFDYTFAGIFGFTLLSLGIFGPTQVFPRLKQKGVLRRYHSTTLKVWQYFVGNVLSNAAIGLIAASIMFIAAVLFFNLNMRGSYLMLGFVAVLGIVMLFGIGLAIGGWAKNENQAAPLAQLASLPMMFLSGVFFPTFLMPEALQKITQFIPLTPVVESVRRIITENAGFAELGPQLGIMAVWTVVIYLVAFRVFRWE